MSKKILSQLPKDLYCKYKFKETRESFAGHSLVMTECLFVAIDEQCNIAITQGRAIQSPKDRFVRKTGREVALGRATMSFRPHTKNRFVPEIKSVVDEHKSEYLDFVAISGRLLGKTSYIDETFKLDNKLNPACNIFPLLDDYDIKWLKQEVALYETKLSDSSGPPA